MKLICPTCKTHSTDWARSSIGGILQCENESCYTQKDSYARNSISIKNISSPLLSYYNLYLLDNKNPEKIWRLFGDSEKNITEIYEIESISLSVISNYISTLQSSHSVSGNGGNIIIHAGSAGGTSSNGGTITLNGGTGGGKVMEPGISVPFIALSLENFHLNANHILERLQNLIIFS